MQTRCPQCQTVHPLEADRPIGDLGAFACNECGAKFDAYAHLTDIAPANDAVDADSDDDSDDQGELFGPRPKPQSAVPRFAQTRIRIPHPPQWRWWLAGAGLLLLLAAIYPIADRERLARDASWRPFVQRVCGVLGCRISPWREPLAFTVIASDVRAHPSVKGTLLVTVTFRNDAAFAQAWPLLELTMSDLDGRDIGMRRFRPQEYLGGATKAKLIAPGQSASATLEIVDPGLNTPSWNIEFR
jgi:hypothetical protein